MKFQMAFAAPFFLWDFPFDVFCFLWHPCSSKMSFWDCVFCSYIHTLLLRCHAFWLLRDFRMRLDGLWAIRDFMGWPYVGNFLMRFPVFACIDFLYWGFLMKRVHAFCYMICWWESHAFEPLCDFLMRCHAFEPKFEICVGEFMLFAA